MAEGKKDLDWAEIGSEDEEQVAPPPQEIKKVESKEPVPNTRESKDERPKREQRDIPKPEEIIKEIEGMNLKRFVFNIFNVAYSATEEDIVKFYDGIDIKVEKTQKEGSFNFKVSSKEDAIKVAQKGFGVISKRQFYLRLSYKNNYIKNDEDNYYKNKHSNYRGEKNFEKKVYEEKKPAERTIIQRKNVESKTEAEPNLHSSTEKASKQDEVKLEKKPSETSPEVEFKGRGNKKYGEEGKLEQDKVQKKYQDRDRDWDNGYKPKYQDRDRDNRDNRDDKDRNYEKKSYQPTEYVRKEKREDNYNDRDRDYRDDKGGYQNKDNRDYRGGNYKEKDYYKKPREDYKPREEYKPRDNYKPKEEKEYKPREEKEYKPREEREYKPREVVEYVKKDSGVKDEPEEDKKKPYNNNHDKGKQHGSGRKKPKFENDFSQFDDDDGEKNKYISDSESPVKPKSNYNKKKGSGNTANPYDYLKH